MGRLMCSSTTYMARTMSCNLKNLMRYTIDQHWRSVAAVATPIVGRSRERRRALSSEAHVPHKRARLPVVLNTVSGSLDELPDPSAGPLKWYSCGPTVYDSAHLGHGRTYVCLDVIRRLLTDYFHLDVIYALGITDVDDKIIARGSARGLKSWDEIAVMARQYEDEFMRDMDDLGVRRPDAVTRVTEHIPDIIAYIERIVENGMAYEAEGGIYFDVERMGSGYGKLGIGEQADGAEGDDLRGKRSHRDFALWKAAKPGEPWWESPFGRGRPGWHIECSAMTHSLFGSNLDVHTGGIDLKFPHHTNEIAQCEAHGCNADLSTICGEVAGVDGGGGQQQPWVRHWLHTGHLHIEGLKMSKSLKNFVTVQEYLDGHAGGRDAAAQDFRMFCLMHKYSSSVTFSEDRMEEARVLRGRLERFLALADSALDAERQHSAVDGPCRWGKQEKRLIKELSFCRREVHHSLCDDFDTPKAVRHLTTLSALFSAHIVSADVGNLGPVRSAAKYTSDTLALLGLRSSGLGKEIGSLGIRGHEGEGAGVGVPLPPVREVVGAMVELRRAMRQTALKHKLENAKHMKRELLELADETRDITLKTLGVQVDDGPNHTCTWIAVPASSLTNLNQQGASETAAGEGKSKGE